MIAFSNPDLVVSVARVIGMGTLTFLVALVLTPILVRTLYRYNFGKNIRNEGLTPVYSQLHAKKAGTPVGGGIIIWGTVTLLALSFWLLSIVFPNHISLTLNFLTRPQTLLPLGALVASAIVGLIDDYLNVRGIGPSGGGLRMKHRLVKRFDQVVSPASFNPANRVFRRISSGQKDDRDFRHLRTSSQGAAQRKAISIGQTDIEQDEINRPAVLIDELVRFRRA
jgi:hypothetical protein